MASKSKSSKQKKKQDKDLKRKNHPKRLGLAKYLPAPKRPKITLNNESEERELKLAKKDKKTFIVSTADQKKMGLLDRCKLQMSSSMLRLIDEDLYKSDSREMSLDKEKFLAYHKAYSSVSKKWPTQPIDFIVKFIKRRLLGKRPIHKFQFADIGCGVEPLLKKKLPSKAKVLSFDLVASTEDITEANMDNLPVPSETVNCAVYSLSLMAKNLGHIILEGKRILKLGGSMMIVEVTSRFEGKENKFAAKLERLGLKQKTMNPLEPNGYFTFFHFTKNDSETDYSYSNLNIQLKSCVYKTR